MSDPVELGGGMLRTGSAATLAWLSQMVAIALQGYAVTRPPATMPAHVGPNGYWDVDSDVVLAQTKGNVENGIRYVRHDLWPGAVHRQRCSERPGAGLVRHSDRCPDTEDSVQGILTSTYPSG